MCPVRWPWSLLPAAGIAGVSASTYKISALPSTCRGRAQTRTQTGPDLGKRDIPGKVKIQRILSWLQPVPTGSIERHGQGYGTAQADTGRMQDSLGACVQGAFSGLAGLPAYQIAATGNGPQGIDRTGATKVEGAQISGVHSLPLPGLQGRPRGWRQEFPHTKAQAQCLKRGKGDAVPAAACTAFVTGYRFLRCGNGSGHAGVNTGVAIQQKRKPAMPALMARQGQAKGRLEAAGRNRHTRCVWPQPEALSRYYLPWTVPCQGVAFPAKNRQYPCTLSAASGCGLTSWRASQARSGGKLCVL